MNINTSSRLGLYALVLMAERPDQLVSASLVASTFEVSENHVAKVLQQLLRAQLVKSVRGAHGGYQLAVPQDELTMLDVIEALEGPFMPECYGCTGRNSGKKCTHSATCVIKGVLEGIGRVAYERLKAVTIGALAARAQDGTQLLYPRRSKRRSEERV